MTDEEFTKFNARLMAAFPNIVAWMNANSPNPEETQAVWRQTLRPCKLDECLTVLSEWIEGTRQPPTPFELPYTALTIRSRVMFERDRLAKRKSKQSDLQTYEDHKRTRGRNNYESMASAPGMRSLLEGYYAGVKLNKDYRAGEYTAQDYERACKQLIESIA